LTSLREKPGSAIEIRQLNAALGEALLDFLLALIDAGDTDHFQPHPFTPEYVATLVRYKGDDLYYVLTEGNRVLAYGMLRGWDEGYSIPSLGIAVHPEARSSGIGRFMMTFLHAAAIRRGCSSVRLRVAIDNTKATALYESLGYQFSDATGGYRIGHLDLRIGQSRQFKSDRGT
jgi:ribosomal protein S18 acetylase RimI-like enzyme